MDAQGAGFLSDVDFKRLQDKDIVICGYDEKNLTDIGYNFTPTEFIFSVNKGALVKIYNRLNEKYCYVEPNDTVLILTREAIWVSEKIGGTFHSKVKLVSDGFGHISTTLDANWEGPLLISLNNPTKKKIKFSIAEDTGKGVTYKSFVTLILYQMVSPAKNTHDNPPCRLDILKEKVRRPKFIDWSGGDYYRLENIVEKIRDTESLRVQIGNATNEEERKNRIESFYDKYKPFTKNLEFYISEAHEINNNIIAKSHTFYWIKALILSSVFLVLLRWGVIAWNKQEANTLAFIAILISVYTPLYSKYVLEEKGGL